MGSDWCNAPRILNSYLYAGNITTELSKLLMSRTWSNRKLPCDAINYAIRMLMTHVDLPVRVASHSAELGSAARVCLCAWAKS